MRSNTDTIEIQEGASEQSAPKRSAKRTSRGGFSSLLAAAAIATTAGVALSPETAEAAAKPVKLSLASTGEKLELDELPFKGTFAHGKLQLTVKFGSGRSTSERTLIATPTKGHLRLSNGQDIEGTISGTSVGSKLVGKLILNEGTKISFEADLSGGSRSSGSRGAYSRSGRGVVSTFPVRTLGGPRSALLLPNTPETFYVDPLAGHEAVPMGPLPNGYDFAPGEPLTLYVTGPAEIDIKLFAEVPVDPAAQTELLNAVPVTVDVKLGGVEMGRFSQKLPVGGAILEGSVRKVPIEPPPVVAAAATAGTPAPAAPTEMEIGLLDRPLAVPGTTPGSTSIQIPEGTYKLVLSSAPDGYSLRAVIYGASETPVPSLKAISTMPLKPGFDAETPAAISFGCRLSSSRVINGEGGARYSLETEAPLAEVDLTEYAPEISPRNNGKREARIRLQKGTVDPNNKVVTPIEPGADGAVIYQVKGVVSVTDDARYCTAERIVPPVHSEGPAHQSPLLLDLKDTGGGKLGVQGTPPSGLTCQVNDYQEGTRDAVRVLTCFQDGDKIGEPQACRTRLDGAAADMKVECKPY